MSNRDPDSPERSLLQVLRFQFEQMIKDLSFCTVGLVQKYDPETKRCDVQVAIDRLLTDGETRMPRGIICNVPLASPALGGFVCHLPAAKGDAVILLFSERGLTEFKKTYRRAAPDTDSLLSERDAIAIPGFGALRQSIPITDGAYLGTEHGESFVAIQRDTVIINSPRVAIASDTLTHNGVNIGSDHTHGGVSPGPGDTGAPN